MKKLRHFKSSTSQSQFMNTKANNAGKKNKKKHKSYPVGRRTARNKFHSGLMNKGELKNRV